VNGKTILGLPAAHTAPALCRNDRQQSWWADLSRPGERAGFRSTDRLWVADLTYVAIPGGFVYLAAILDAWSRQVVGYALGCSMDARIAVTALKAAIRNFAKGCIHHSERGSQYASEVYRSLLTAHGLVGSMIRGGNHYDNAKAESFMKP
jgi:putative transposase